MTIATGAATTPGNARGARPAADGESRNGPQRSGRRNDPSLGRRERIGGLGVVNTTSVSIRAETGHGAPMVGRPGRGASGIRSFGTDRRPESSQPVGDLFRIADEFGPCPVEIDRGRRVERVVQTVIDGKPVRSADHPTLLLPAAPWAVAFEARRSPGGEGIAPAPDGTRLRPMLEGPLFVDDPPAPEKVGGREVLRIVALAPASGALGRTTGLDPLVQPGHAIGDVSVTENVDVVDRAGSWSAATTTSRSRLAAAPAAPTTTSRSGSASPTF